MESKVNNSYDAGWFSNLIMLLLQSVIIILVFMLTIPVLVVGLIFIHGFVVSPYHTGLTSFWGRKLHR